MLKDYPKKKCLILWVGKGRGPYAKRENGLVNIGADELAYMAEILGYEAKDLGIFFTINVLERERIN